MKRMIIKLAGVSYGNAQKNIQKFGYKDFCWYGLRREPQNPYDPNAISIHCIGHHLGYVPKGNARTLAQRMDAGEEFDAKFVSRNEHPYYDTVGLTVEIVPAQDHIRRNTNERSEI